MSETRQTPRTPRYLPVSCPIVCVRCGYGHDMGWMAINGTTHYEICTTCKRSDRATIN